MVGGGAGWQRGMLMCSIKGITEFQVTLEHPNKAAQESNLGVDLVLYRTQIVNWNSGLGYGH
jgi:hypothetical protein